VRRYPQDVFPSIQPKIDGLIASGKWVAVEGVKDEIQHVGSPPLKSWAKANKRQFVPHDTALLTEANAISAAYPGLIDPYAHHDEADRYVIALAKINGWTVVTHETPALSKKRPPRTHYIPDVCRALKVPCIDLLSLMRNEKWAF